MQTLTTQQVHSLNRKHGAGLEEGKGKMYVQSFLINSQQNQAGDPHPFRVDDQLLPRLARTAIGMPWLPYPKSDGNHQRPIGASAFTADGIKQHQQQFAGGEIVAQYTNESTGNVNVIIDVFPEYQEAVRSKKIPAFVSPMVFPHEMTPSGLVKEGEILHLQSVHHPGYAPEVAKINSVCEGNGLKQCMTQMKALAASGKLAPFQSKVKNYIAKNVSPADKTQMGKVKIGGETNWYDANKNEFQFSPEYKHNFPNPEKLPIVVQHEIGHMHWHHTLTPAQRKAFAKNVPKDLEISPYAIQHKRMLFKAVIAFRKDKSNKNRKAVKRAYGEYIREVFAILHSMRQEPDYVQRLKTDGLKQGMSAYMGALGAAGPSDADIQKFDKKMNRQTQSYNKHDKTGLNVNKMMPLSFEDVVIDNYPNDKRRTKLSPSTEEVKNQLGELARYEYLKDGKKTKALLSKIFKNNPGLKKVYDTRARAVSKLNRHQSQGFKNAPVFWRGTGTNELNDMLKRKHTRKVMGRRNHVDTGELGSLTLDKKVAEEFMDHDLYDDKRALLQYDANILRKKGAVRPILHGQSPLTNIKNAGWYGGYFDQREVTLDNKVPLLDKNNKPQIINKIHFKVKSKVIGERMKKKYGGLAKNISYEITPTEPTTKNKMGRSDRWDKEERGDMRDGDPDEFDYENYDFKFDPTSKGKRQWHRNPHMKEEYEDQIEDLREDDLLIAEHKKGKFKLPTRLQPALAGDPMRVKKAKRQMQAKRELMRKKLNRKTKILNRLGEEGQSDRAAERYKAEQSEDKILTKKNTSAKYRRQVKDDRSAYARKNPKYAALRPELRKHMSLKTRRANKMGRGHGEMPALRKHNKSVFRKMPNDSKKKMFARVKNEDKSRLANYEKRMQLPEAPHMMDNFRRIRENRKQLDRKTKVANRMGVKPDANMIKTAFSNVLGAQTA